MDGGFTGEAGENLLLWLYLLARLLPPFTATEYRQDTLIDRAGSSDEARFQRAIAVHSTMFLFVVIFSCASVVLNGGFA